MKDFKFSKSLAFMTISVIILIVAVVGATYAYYQKVLFNDLTISNTVTKGLDYYINYTKGTSVSDGTLMPSSTYSGGLNASVSLYKKDNTYNIYGQIYLDVSQIGNNLKNNAAFKYAVVDESDNVISQNTLSGTNSNSSVLVAKNISMVTTSKTYYVYVWLDENTLTNYNIEDEAFAATIRCEATMKPIA